MTPDARTRTARTLTCALILAAVVPLGLGVGLVLDWLR